MDNPEYKNVLARLDAMSSGTKSDIADVYTHIDEAKDEMMRYMGVLIEGVNHKLDLLVEGFQSVNRKVETNEQRNALFRGGCHPS